jgi:hypothetical protein
VNGRGRHPELAGDPDGSEALPPAERDDSFHQVRVGAVWGAVGSRGPVLHPRFTHRGIAVGPPFRGRPRHVEEHRGVTDRPPVVDDETRDAESLAWGQGSVSVGQEGLLGECVN